MSHKPFPLCKKALEGLKDDYLFEISVAGTKEGKNRNKASNTGGQGYTFKTDIFLKFITLRQFLLKF